MSSVDDWTGWMRAQSWSEQTITERIRTVRRVAGDRDPITLEQVDVVAFLAGDFSAASRHTYDAMRRAGVPGTCHSLRHWYASTMLRNGADIRVIQQLMRHASLSTTERYLHIDVDQRRTAGLLLPMMV